MRGLHRPGRCLVPRPRPPSFAGLARRPRRREWREAVRPRAQGLVLARLALRRVHCCPACYRDTVSRSRGSHRNCRLQRACRDGAVERALPVLRPRRAHDPGGWHASGRGQRHLARLPHRAARRDLAALGPALRRLRAPRERGLRSAPLPLLRAVVAAAVAGHAPEDDQAPPQDPPPRARRGRRVVPRPAAARVGRRPAGGGRGAVRLCGGTAGGLRAGVARLVPVELARQPEAASRLGRAEVRGAAVAHEASALGRGEFG
mmetsp:Transcript_81040/g.204026  ORF Transcript_81040/g.204026 Transcript_81040/m.204026 type:complete len:261 (-) Transcript_81040:594-1376(-)